MLELIIASDVTVQSLTLKLDELNEYVVINDYLLFSEKDVEKKMWSEHLETLNQKLVNKISALLPILEQNNSSTTTYGKIVHNHRIYKINYRQKRQFEIGQLLSLHSIINATISLNGILYIFNKSVLHQFKNASVISILKLKRELTLLEIQNEILELSREFKSVKVVQIRDVEESIKFLRRLGLVDQDPFANEKYKLTAKGYMFDV